MGQASALKATLFILLTLLFCLMAGVTYASVDSSYRLQRLSSDLLTVSEGSRTYDGLGRLKTVTTADSDLIQFLYDANNNLTRLTYPDGKQVNYTHNSRNLLATITDWSNRVTSYSYDRLGRLTGTTRPNGTSNQIAHDAASQLTSIKESSGTKLISYLAFKYDAAGQIQSRFRAPLVNSGWQHPTLTATYDDDNRLLTANGQPVTHDADGNMTRSVGILPTSPNTAVDLTYNSRNQLTAAAGVSYTYDAEGRRRTLTDATGTTRDAIDPSGKLLVRTYPNNTKTYFVYGLGLLYEADGLTNTTKTYHFDQVGSTLARTDDSGKVIGQAEYSAYGLTIWKQGDMATPFLYNGQAGVQTDPNGLLHMRARYYSPYLMRFLNADPSGFSGGPNWFAYADGNPISKSDPFGLCAQGGGGIWNSIKNGAVNFIGSTVEGWEDQDRQIAVGATKYNNWYNQQTTFIQNAELLNFVGIPPAYATNFSDHKGEVLIMGTIALMSQGRVRAGPLAEMSAAGAANGGSRIASEAGLSAGEIARIENAANRIGKPINLVGSRASGTANAASDWDYVIEGMTNANKNTIKNSLPGAQIRADQVPRNIDFFTEPLRTDLPHIQFNPR
jgi:RHS repeat-associated protein